ncbi:GPI mannosyltransferase 3 [Penicillium brevicompactum]|uniref:Mannosyltransferase n=1 Tax=Penicillium brevicompactum TaxID=5074 RepID=A0A9W9UEB0_PENBR|nr:GPI mannosyltransferase 3 [Penicillium brevicompactum]
MPLPYSPRRPVHQPPRPIRNILLFLIAYRLVNAFTVRTFFQPDEYFQSLEPAWEIAFGKDQGAWITWEWRHQLRSSLHPLFFAALYRAADFLATILGTSPATRAELLIAVPKAAQAVIAAIGDYYTWKLAIRVYGTDSRGAWTTLAATVLNPWQWFCSTRTLSNCLETTLTIAALELWPWKWSAGTTTDNGPGNIAIKKGQEGTNTLIQRYDCRSSIATAATDVLCSLHRCLPLAALACILRPTNVLIWATLACFAWLRTTWAQRRVLISEAVICGSAVLAVSVVADRLFYGIWTFPPLRFLYFNVAQSLAVFYGSNNWHYYATEGYPLLLTTLLPFAILGLYRKLSTRNSSLGDPIQSAICVQLATVCVAMPLALSVISHKEVRFIYPLLPALHILAAPPLVQFFYPALYSPAHSIYQPRRLVLLFLLLVNVVVALYTTLYHARGPLSVLSYLRGQHQQHAIQPVRREPEMFRDVGISVGFLMPCHSTPWRSHLVHPSITAWALSCEPPIDMNATQKAVYRDEADQFYDDPAGFLRTQMAGGLRFTPEAPSYYFKEDVIEPHLHEWPDYLVFFAQLDPTLRTLLRSSYYDECWRTHNTDWHDDWRRRGDIVVWCLDTQEQDEWRDERYRRDQQSRDRQFDRIIHGFKKGKQQKSSWRAFLPSISSPSPPSTLASWRSSIQSVFSTKSSKSSFAWPWRRKTRWETFLENFGLGQRTSWWSDWVPSFFSSKKRVPTERELFA